MATVIKVENLSKQYRLGNVGSGTLRDDLTRWWYRMRGKEDPLMQVGSTNDRTQKADSDYVWALKDINFEVQQGDTLGIIGRNGAGKSTLLKILSKTTAPTTGSVKVKGRIASLLEVGTGFHPELTGRENIYLNGAILGMRKHEITRKLDEIVDFAGVERYLDTPVKRYSSGMYVRLAFGVAAHLESEILIIDEVLAVGDAEFQKKCLGKMGEVSKGEGRTVLFVSHNIAAIKTLCKQGIVLSEGQLTYIGDATAAATKYMVGGAEFSNYRVFDQKYTTDSYSLHEIRINAVGKNVEEPLDEYDELHIETVIFIKNKQDSLHYTYVLKQETGQPVFTFSHSQAGVQLNHGVNRLICKLPKGWLNIGTYHLDAYLIKDAREAIFTEKDILSFSIQEGERTIGAWMGREPGIIKPTFEWINQPQ
jgi:lipopolysaccharide transport system ATP-binding protein